MDVAKAITILREKIGVTQQGLAKSLGVTVTSISRYENGREPSRQILKKLAAISESSNLIDLRDVFTANWKAGIVARIKKLPSAGTGRHIPLDELKRWHDAPPFLAEQLEMARKVYMEIILKNAVDPRDSHRLGSANQIMLGLIHNFLPELKSSIEPYINIAPEKIQ